MISGNQDVKMKDKEHETFELTEDVFARWDKENEKWYNKYFVIPFHFILFSSSLCAA